MSIIDRAQARAYIDALDDDRREALDSLRELVLEVGAEPPVGGVIEEIRWGVPSYAPTRARVGSPVRLGTFGPKSVALYVHCATTLIEEFRNAHGDRLVYEGRRAVVLDPVRTLPRAALRDCIERALTYHVRRRRQAAGDRGG